MRPCGRTREWAALSPGGSAIPSEALDNLFHSGRARLCPAHTGQPRPARSNRRTNHATSDV